MKNIYVNIILLFPLLSFSNEVEQFNLQISRSKSHEDQTGNLTPLVISLSTEDQSEKVKGVNLICIVDVSWSMNGTKLNFVKETLNYLVNLMDKNDSFALVAFNSDSTIIKDLSITDPLYKKDFFDKINSLKASGGTNILSGLKTGLDLIKYDFSNGEKVCSMILLSDGGDNNTNIVANFKDYISSKGKNNYSFTLHSFGYGDDHNSELMNQIALIREGQYFNIRKLFMVKDFFLEIYGSLSTVYIVNVNLNVHSNFKIQKVYGIENMHQASLNDNGMNFSTSLIHLVYGKNYKFVMLVNVPQNTKIGTEILRVTVLPFVKTVSYFWDQTYNPYAYEEYIRCISMTYLLNSYNAGKDKGITIINQGIEWIKSNYDGIKDWLKEYYDILEDLKNFNSFGKANILSKLNELKFLKLGIYDDENSYQRKIIVDSYKIDLNGFNFLIQCMKLFIQEIYKYNYFYFYIKKGIGEINNLHFSGTESSIIIYSKKPPDFYINCQTTVEIYYKYENIARIQTIIDFSKGGKFIYEKDFPFDFYVRIDGKKDITFNIQFIKFETEEIFDLQEHIFEIDAYIVDEQYLEILKNCSYLYYIPNNKIGKGFYDKGFRIGKIILKKEEIYKYLNPNSYNYLYIIVQKATDSNIIYKSVEGQFSFVSMDYINSIAPENSYIFSSLSIGQRTPHLYALQMESNLNKIMRIEFATSSDELDCKILKYQKYLPGTEEFYIDNSQFNITRKNHMGKTYIDITQSYNIIMKIDKIILSIFSKYGDHIAGSENQKLSYTIRYSTYSGSGIYNFNDLYDKDGEIEILQSDKDERNFIINFYPLKYSKNNDEYINEKARFFIKVYPIIKLEKKFYQTISFLEDNIPEIFIEKNISNENEANFQIQIDPNKRYFFTIYTISSKNHEILSYQINKAYIIPSNIEIKDDYFFEDELLGEQNLEFNISENNEKNYLIIRISGFEKGNYGILYATVGDKIYKSVQPSDNIIIITRKNCIGKRIKVETKMKEGKKITYILTIKMVNQVEINAGENLFFEMLEEYEESMEILVKHNSELNKMNIFVQSLTGEFTIKGIDTIKSDFFGAKSSNFMKIKIVFFEIKAKTGDFISLYTHIISNTKQQLISNHEISLYGYLEEKDCIYFDESIVNIKKYQVRIIADKIISIRYNKDTTYEYTEPGVLYLKEFSEKIDKICLKQKYDSERIFFGLQIVDTSDQKSSNIILQPSILGAFYKDILYKDEIRYYRQGLLDNNKISDLRYIYNVKQIKGEIKVFISQCENFPNCEITKKDLENNNKIISLYNIDGSFTFSTKAKDFSKYTPKNILIYIIICLSDSCEYSFIINKSTSFIDLTILKKYSSKIYKSNIDKFTISPKNNNSQLISISVYTHSGEIMLSINDNCKEIRHMIFGHCEKIEIPKSCNINHPFEIYIQANIDSIYSIEYSEISDIKYTKIKSNIIHIENIYKEKIIEYTPVKSSYFIKFIPINCEISIKYAENGYKNVISQNKIYYYNSNLENEKYYNFTISTNNLDCMIYTYLEELTENFYGILSDQVPYYLSLNKNNTNYKLIYPLTNGNYNPLYRINFFKETHIKINQRILDEKDEEINAVTVKDIKPSSKILEKCNENDICYLIIEIEYEADDESPIILEIIPKSINKVPGILLDNIIKQDFASLDGPEQKYMTKIQKDEEGEIYFNYKYFSGEIIGNIININKKSWKNIHDLPKPNEYLIYDSLKQKISFSKKETNKCDNGCYLFVEINCLEKLKDKIYYQGLYMDYSIYLKKSNNLVQLRLNEIIIGTLSKTLEDNYIDYYSIEIPYTTSKIYIDYSSEKTNIIINSGNIKPSFDKYQYSFNSTGKAQIFTINNYYQTIDSKGYFIIGIYKLNNGVSQYSLRIRAENNLLKNYIYSDSIDENFCVTNNNNKSCYFLIPIVNIQQNANLFLYSISSNISDNIIISYKKIRLYENINDEPKFDFQFEKTSKDQFIKNMLFISNSELNMNENENILIKIEAPDKGTITLLHTFKGNLYESLLSQKNKILYAMNPNEELYLNIPNGVKSLIHINSIKGKGKIGYELDDNNSQIISGKYYELYLQSLENNDNKRIKIKTDSVNSFYFYIYIKIGSIKRNINNISLGSANLRTGEGFPIEFYSKISENEGYTINFNINNIKEIEDQNSEISNFKIKAYIVTEEIIERLKLDDTFVFSKAKPFIGKYETGFGILKLILSIEDIKKYYEKFKNNYIYLIMEELNTNPSILKNIKGEISILQNNKLNYVAPENIYINSNLEPNIYSTHRYKLIKKNINDKIIRVEFSSSSDNVKYRIYNNEINRLSANSSLIDYEEKENLGKKNIDIKLNDDNGFYIFEVYSDKIVDNKNKLSYTLRYRTDEGTKIFNNYKTIDKTNGELKIKIQNNDRSKNFEISIPSIQQSQTLEKVNSTYYLKIYKYDKNETIINNTISIVDGIEPNITYKFKFDGIYYNKNIEIPKENLYYITLTAITPDKELLAYKSYFLIDIDDIDDYKSNGWAIFIIIIIVILFLVILAFIIYFILNKRKSIDVNQLPLMKINNNDDLEEKD